MKEARPSAKRVTRRSRREPENLSEEDSGEDEEEEEEIPVKAPPPARKKPSKRSEPSKGPRPELPYKNVPEVVIPPVTIMKKKVAFEPIPVTERGPAFIRKAPVEEKSLGTETLVDKMLGTPLTITVGDLLGLDRNLREAFKKKLDETKNPELRETGYYDRPVDRGRDKVLVRVR